ncbi:glycosyltransferase family 2 protein [Ferdinandcohnia sp. SAFN-114]|uniref:glycosyltransferase family 2 protein n=1 Tax=Ferdinandcohnia sp. SAFN-114 TaxID=3387275 RepID=UPI003F80B66D
MNPKVTVILTSYNKPTTVGMAVESVINQTLPDWELFIMDDASNAETRSILQKYLQDKRITYINSEIKNEDRYKTTRYATLINEAISKSTGKYLTYLTDDNLYERTRLEKMSNYLDKYPNRDIVYSKQKVRFIDSNGKCTSEMIRNTKGVLSKPQNLVDHCSVMHTRNSLKKVQKRYGSYWDDDPINWHNADAAFWGRLASIGPFYPLDEVLDICMKSPTSFQQLNAFLPKTIPNGTLIKGLSGKVYLVDDQKRREIDSNMFSILRYKQNKIVQVPDPVLFRFPESEPIDKAVFHDSGKFPNGRLVKEKNMPPIYYIESNKKRHIVNQKVFKKLNFHVGDIIEVSREFLDGFQVGTPLTATFTGDKQLPEGFPFKYGQKLFVSHDGLLHSLHPKVAAKLNFTAKQFTALNHQEYKLFKKGNSFEWKVKHWK